MKKLLSTLTIILLTLSVTAQDEAPLTKQEKKMLRKEQKKQYEKMLEVNTAQAIQSGRYILKADQVRGRGGVYLPVNPTINFIAVEGKTVYVQLGSETGIGYNGVGGITLKGEMTSYKVEQDKGEGTYFIQINTTGSSGALTIMMHVNIRGDMTTATVRTNWGSRVDFSGDLVPAGSHIFKGTESL